MTTKTLTGSSLKNFIDAAQLPTGSILQVVQTVKTDVFTTTSTSLGDITGLTVSITPTATSSKILVMAVVTGAQGSTTRMPLYLARGGTVLAQGDAASARTRAHSAIAIDATRLGVATLHFLDSPASVASLTYSVQTKVITSGTQFINRSENDADDPFRQRGVSTITVMEVAG